MFDTIQLTVPEVIMESDPLKQFQVDSFLTESKDMDEECYNANDVFTEAVFEHGRETVKPIVDLIQDAKNILDQEINNQNQGLKDNKPRPFDPDKYWKNTVFKDMENEVIRVFGFRTVNIYPYIEKYDSKEKIFASKILQCDISYLKRYPIDGLVTDKGYYDKTHSSSMDIFISLGMIKSMSANEIMACFLHEFGHAIDPALVDIKYLEVNALSKYLTDRKGSINQNEKKAITRGGKPMVVVPFLMRGLKIGGNGFLNMIQSAFSKKNPDQPEPLKHKFSLFGWLFNSEKKRKKKIEKELDQIRDIVKNDKEFNRQNYSEAFADNFARMYGFGTEIASMLKKISFHYDKQLHSRITKEKERQDSIIRITKECLKDIHKTDLHRIHALIREYEEDLKNPNISPATKKAIKEDKEELEKLIDAYLNHFDELQARIYKIINEELTILDKKSASASSTSEEKLDTKDVKKESMTLLEYNETLKGIDPTIESITESTEEPIYESKKKHLSLSAKEYEEAHKKFGKKFGCSIGKDKNGYFCYTHRARSKSYPSISSIPKEKYDFICSTS